MKQIISYCLLLLITGCHTKNSKVSSKSSTPHYWPPHLYTKSTPWSFYWAVEDQQYLHNHPRYVNACPPNAHVVKSYDANKVKELARKAGLRPVDYLHRMNKKRYETRIINSE